MKLALFIIAGIVIVLLLIVIGQLETISETLQQERLARDAERTRRVKMPWESDSSNFNVAKPGGSFPDQM